MKPSVMVWSAVLLALAGCQKASKLEGDEAVEARAALLGPSDAAPYDTHLPMAEFMGHVMQHAGDGIWKWQGIILDKAGEHSLYPKNDEEWEEAESGALSLAETTNLLLLPGRRVADPAWDKSVDAVRKIALEAAKAAEKHDKSAFMAAGSQLDDACDSCHIRFDSNFQGAPR